MAGVAMVQIFILSLTRGCSPATVPRGKLLQPVPVIPSPEAPGWLCGRKGDRSPSPWAPGRCHPPPGHEGPLTSEPLAQDALQQLAEGSEVRRGVCAGPPILPQPQHPTCGEGSISTHGCPSWGWGCVWGDTYGNSSAYSPREGRWCCRRCPTPRQDVTHPGCPQPHRTETQVNFLKTEVRCGTEGGNTRSGGRAGPATAAPGPGRPHPARPGPRRQSGQTGAARGRAPGRGLPGEAGTGPGGPRSPLKALSSGSFLAMGSSPRPGGGPAAAAAGREPGTGNREGAGPRPGSGAARPRGGVKPTPAHPHPPLPLRAVSHDGHRYAGTYAHTHICMSTHLQHIGIYIYIYVCTCTLRISNRATGAYIYIRICAYYIRRTQALG